jgi:nucleoside-diphosphate-sugar epimerase
MTKAWQAGPTTFTPEDMGVSTLARGFGRSVAELDPANHSPPGEAGPIPARPTTGDVVVTGGAGFLGTRVLKALLEDGGGTTIHVCSRNPQGAAGLDPRISPLAVDLSADDALAVIGLRLGDRPVRTVIHLAAAVDAFAPRERLTAANEDATRNAIALAAATGARLVHASTLSVFVSSDMGGEDRETSLRNEPGRMLLGGYAQTKAVADMLVEDAAAAGVDACSLRLGLLVPEGRRDMEPASFLSAFRDALASVGAVPETSEEAAVDLTPVDQAAACIVALADAREVPTFVHYANPCSAPLSMVVGQVLGPMPKVLDDAAWDARVADQPSIRRALLEAAFRKSRFLSGRCAARPLANADLFQSTARRYDVSTATGLGAPVPRSPEEMCATLFGGAR